MYSRVSALSDFLLKLQDNSRHLDVAPLVADAVSDLADILGFDSAWYGWAQLDPQETVIHANMSLNLPASYYESWQAMADQDVLVEQFLEDPTGVPTYDRSGNVQTDGMEHLADTFGLKKMATAMCIRPGRAASFYLSAYRCGQTAPAWDLEDREFLQCAVNNISQSARSAAAKELSSGSGASASAYVSRRGNIVVGLAEMHERFGHLWSRRGHDRLPRLLMDYIGAAGEHLLPEEDLVIKCEPGLGPHGMDWRKLSIRPMNKLDVLTPREREVAQALAQGKTHKMVAIDLGTSPSTVRNQTQAIYGKLKIGNRADLAKLIAGVL
ncbi:helix-turn-helix transcriptional regulator [Tropicibacter sp. R16_0]|uniref:helix-turn-helix transcriptional regulator n=1 Tax=Tropicibacter sp. R16_0 TaxID=2821102 RepID=UPI0025709D7E|nr:helix-turn-helix transcriptional regulator [Tropicibacter sp. R16_0]